MQVIELHKMCLMRVYPLIPTGGCSALFRPGILWPEGDGDDEKDLDLAGKKEIQKTNMKSFHATFVISTETK